MLRCWSTMIGCLVIAAKLATVRKCLYVKKKSWHILSTVYFYSEKPSKKHTSYSKPPCQKRRRRQRRQGGNLKQTNVIFPQKTNYFYQLRMFPTSISPAPSSSSSSSPPPPPPERMRFSTGGPRPTASQTSPGTSCKKNSFPHYCRNFFEKTKTRLETVGCCIQEGK